MSHPIPSHDYTEKSSDESNKEYKNRAKAGMSVKSKIAKKMKDPKEGIFKKYHKEQPKKPWSKWNEKEKQTFYKNANDLHQ